MLQQPWFYSDTGYPIQKHDFVTLVAFQDVVRATEMGYPAVLGYVHWTSRPCLRIRPLYAGRNSGFSWQTQAEFNFPQSVYPLVN